MIISHIAAISKNFVIGKDKRLPWHLPDELAYFHKVTSGHMVIMGRKNYQANGKALNNRTNIVITSNPDFSPNDAIVVKSIPEAINYAEEFHPEEVFIVGGGEIYKQTLSITDRIYLTVIDLETEGDTYYPRINFDDYKVISSVPVKAYKDHPYDHTYYILEKN